MDTVTTFTKHAYSLTNPDYIHMSTYPSIRHTATTTNRPLEPSLVSILGPLESWPRSAFWRRSHRPKSIRKTLSRGATARHKQQLHSLPIGSSTTSHPIGAGATSATTRPSPSVCRCHRRTRRASTCCLLCLLCHPSFVCRSLYVQAEGVPCRRLGRIIHRYLHSASSNIITSTALIRTR